MEEEIKKRSQMLDNIIPELFKNEIRPSRELIKDICIYKRLAINTVKIGNPKSIKIKDDEIEEIFDRFGSKIEVMQKRAKVLECPLSCSVIETKWVGVCGHVFEQSVIQGYMKKSKTCPVVGCGKTLKEAY